jgi:hypothetical protein
LELFDPDFLAANFTCKKSGSYLFRRTEAFLNAAPAVQEMRWVPEQECYRAMTFLVMAPNMSA